MQGRNWVVPKNIKKIILSDGTHKEYRAYHWGEGVRWAAEHPADKKTEARHRLRLKQLLKDEQAERITWFKSKGRFETLEGHKIYPVIGTYTVLMPDGRKANVRRLKEAKLLAEMNMIEGEGGV